MVGGEQPRTGLAGLAGVAVRSFLGALLAFTLLGAGLGVLCYHLLARVHPAYGLVAGAVALLESVAVGAILAGKRALVVSLIHGLRTRRLGRSAVGLVFGRLLDVSPGQTPGGGGAVARTAARLPLAQAERRLSQAVRDLLGAPAEGGGPAGALRRRLQAGLLSRARAYTLARFREGDAREGGLDPARVRADLERRVDDFLAARLKRGVDRWTALVVVGLSVQVIGLALLALALLRH
jgi:hypothetical protein